MDWYYISAIVAALANFCLGWFVFSRNRKSPINKLFAAVTFIIAAWCYGFFKVNTAPNATTALFWDRFMYVGIVFLPSVHTHLVLTLIGATHKRRLITVLYSMSVLLLILNLTSLFIKGETPHARFGFMSITGPAYPLFVLFFIWAAIYVSFQIYRTYRTCSHYKRNQLRYFILATLLAVVGGCVFFLNLYEINVPPIDNMMVIAFTGTISYAIVKHRLMDIGIIIKKGVIYGISTGLITAAFVFFVLGFERLFRHYTGYATLPVAAVAALIIAFLFYPLKNRVQRVVDKYFYKRAYDYHEVLSNASKAMTSILDFEKLLSYILTVVSNSMKIEQNWILLRSSGARKYEVKLAAAFDERHKCPMVPPLPSNNILMTYLRTDREPVVREEMERMLPPGEAESLSNEMKRFNADIAVPIMLKNRLMGAVLLGPKLSGDIYSGEDLQLLSTLANQAAIAIRNAQLYTRLQKDLDTIRYLEREKAKAERLASLGTMAAGIAHEIKNPLVSIKTFAQLLPERASDPEFRDEFSKIAVKEIDRIDSLVLGLLSLAKPSPPSFEAVNVNSILDETLTPVHLRLDEKGIQLKKEYQEGLPQVMGDSLQLKQVFSNIIINGMQATSQGGSITVITLWRRDSRNRNGYVEIRIRDTGVGISQEESEKIFDPFFTTKHEGVGLGLPICHRIMEDHQGDIRLESEKDVGTTCVISVPAIDTDRSRMELDDEM